MKLLFSEQNSDYENYQFPYAIWAVPEAGETPADIFTDETRIEFQVSSVQFSATENLKLNTYPCASVAKLFRRCF